MYPVVLVRDAPRRQSRRLRRLFSYGYRIILNRVLHSLSLSSIISNSGRNPFDVRNPTTVVPTHNAYHHLIKIRSHAQESHRIRGGRKRSPAYPPSMAPSGRGGLTRRSRVDATARSDVRSDGSLPAQSIKRTTADLLHLQTNIGYHPIPSPWTTIGCPATPLRPGRVQEISEIT